MEVTSDILSEELVQRAEDLVPLLRRNSYPSSQNRRLTDETVSALTEAGIFRMRIPARFGGYECDNSTVVNVGIQLGRGDASAAFNVAAWWIMSWLLGHFPDEVQEEVFADPDTRICGTLAPTGTAIPTADGIIVSGQWAWNSGVSHSQWKLLSAILPTPDGGAEPILAVAPAKAFTVVDDWDVSGLSGTGSVSVKTSDLFIPSARYMHISSLLREEYASKANADSPSYRGPLIGAISACTIGKIVGIAQAASELFMARLPGHAITNTSYASKAEAPVTHLAVGEASLLVDEAGFHAHRLAGMVDRKSSLSEPWTMSERSYARAAVGRACQLAQEAVNILTQASGASALYNDVPLHRKQRDLQAISLHALNLPSTNLELYGRVLCGLEPNTFMV